MRQTSPKSIEAPGRLENLKELIHAMEEFENLGGFLEHVSLVMENAEAGDRDQLSIMTLHGAKGLEFDIVFLPGWEEGLFPSQRSLDENGLKGLEEERRLAYVGITRARKLSYISHAANRRVHNQWQNALPSRFIAELPKEHIERRDDQTFHRSQGSFYRTGFSEPRWAGATYMQRAARRQAGDAQRQLGLRGELRRGLLGRALLRDGLLAQRFRLGSLLGESCAGSVHRFPSLLESLRRGREAGWAPRRAPSRNRYMRPRFPRCKSFFATASSSSVRERTNRACAPL